MHFIVLFILFSGLTLALIIHENVASYQANDIAITISKRLSTFNTDLEPYENFFNKLSDDLGKARITAHSIEQL